MKLGGRAGGRVQARDFSVGCRPRRLQRNIANASVSIHPQIIIYQRITMESLGLPMAFGSSNSRNAAPPQHQHQHNNAMRGRGGGGFGGRGGGRGGRGMRGGPAMRGGARGGHADGGPAAKVGGQAKSQVRELSG